MLPAPTPHYFRSETLEKTFRRPSPPFAPPVPTAALSSDARETCNVRRNLSTRVKFFFHAERSGRMVKSAFGDVRSAPDGDDERLGRRSAQAKWQVRTCAPDAPDADRVRLRVLVHGAPAPLAPPWRPSSNHLSTFQKKCDVLINPDRDAASTSVYAMYELTKVG